VLSIGYNGVASGQPHCNESELRGADYAPVPGQPDLQAPGRMVRLFPHACRDSDLAPGLDGCEAVHAEQNAMLQCRDPDAVWAAHVTLSPCKACLKLLLGTPCQAIVFGEPHEDQAPGGLWVRAGRSWHHLAGHQEAPPGQNPDPLARPGGPGGRF